MEAAHTHPPIKMIRSAAHSRSKPISRPLQAHSLVLDQFDSPMPSLVIFIHK